VLKTKQSNSVLAAPATIVAACSAVLKSSGQVTRALLPKQEENDTISEDFPCRPTQF